MPTRSKEPDRTKNNNRRTQVKDLPKSEKELSKEEQKKIKGGGGGAGSGWPAFGKQ